VVTLTTSAPFGEATEAVGRSCARTGVQTARKARIINRLRMVFTPWGLL
jgi:hypothetical protein